MARYKHTSAGRVPLTPAEEAARNAEEAAWTVEWAQQQAAEQARKNRAQANRTVLEQATGLTLDEIRDVLTMG